MSFPQVPEAGSSCFACAEIGETRAVPKKQAVVAMNDLREIQLGMAFPFAGESGGALHGL